MPDARLQLLDEVRYLSEALQVHRARIARALRTTTAQWATLAAVGSGDTVPRTARRLGLTRQSVQRTADTLVAARLARYHPNPNHRRSPVLVPTQEGENLLGRLQRGLDRGRASLGETLEPEDVETALLVLRALRDDVERA